MDDWGLGQKGVIVSLNRALSQSPSRRVTVGEIQFGTPGIRNSPYEFLKSRAWVDRVSVLLKLFDADFVNVQRFVGM